MLFEVRFRCVGFPEGYIEHGKLKIQAKGCGEQLAREMINNLIQHPHEALEDNTDVTDVLLLEEHEEEALDPCLEIIEGHGDALVFNPLGERKYGPQTIALLRQQGLG